MAEFDPDAYLSTYGGGAATAAPPAPGGFDPDAYLKQYAPKPSGFDPDSYLKAYAPPGRVTGTPEEQSQALDATSRGLAMMTASPAGIIAQAQEPAYIAAQATDKTNAMMNLSPAGLVAQSEEIRRQNELDLSTGALLAMGGKYASESRMGTPELTMEDPQNPVDPGLSALPVPRIPERKPGESPLAGRVLAASLGPLGSLLDPGALDPTARGLGNVGVGAWNFVTSPEGAAMSALGGVGASVVRQAVTLGFSALGVKALYEAPQKIAEATTPQQRAEEVGNAIMGGVMVFGGAVEHLKEAGVPEADIKTQTEQSVAQMPDPILQFAAGNPELQKSIPDVHAAITQELARRKLEPINPDEATPEQKQSADQAMYDNLDKAKVDADLTQVLNQHPEETAAQTTATPLPEDNAQTETQPPLSPTPRESLPERQGTEGTTGSDTESVSGAPTAGEDAGAAAAGGESTTETTGISEGPGAAASTEFPEQRTTGLQRAVVDTERLARGAEPIPTVDRQREEQVVQQAEDRIDADKTAAPSLVARIVDGGENAITEHDAATLLVERARLMNERTKWEEVSADESASPAERQQAKTELDGIETQTSRLDEAQRAAGSTWGRLGHMYQRMIQEDFTLEAMERKQRAAKGGPLSEDERATIKDQAAKISELQKAVEDAHGTDAQAREKETLTSAYEATVKSLQSELASRPKFGKDVFDIARGVVNRWKADAELAHTSLREKLGRTSAGVDPSILLDVARIMRAHIGEIGLDLTESSARLVEEYGPKIKPYLEKAWEKARQMIEAEKTPTAVKAVVKRGVPKTQVDVKSRAKAEAIAGEELSHKTVHDLALAHIRAGVHGEDAVMKVVHADIKEAYPEATERDVRRAFSEYGKAKFPSKEADKVELAELRNLTRLQESIDRLKEGQDALKTGLQRDKATQAIREKQAQLNELLKKRQGPPSPERLASMDEARQTALRNRMADIDKELQTGVSRPKSEPAPPSDATEALMSERDAMQEKLNEVRRSENPGKTPAEKQVEQLSAIKDRLNKVLAGDLDPKKAKDFVPLSDAASDIKAEIHAMQELAAQMRRDANPKDPNAGIERAKIKALEDSIKRYEDKTAASDFSTQGKTQGPDSKAVSELKAIRDARKAVYDAAKKASKPVLTPEGRYNSTRQKAIVKQLADVKARISANKYERPVKRVTPVKSPETLKAEAELGKWKSKFNQGLMDAEQAKRTKFQKSTDWVAGFTRANVLGHVSVLEHLGGAAVENIATRPIGSAAAQLFRFNRTLDAIRKKAVYEGGWGGEMKGAAATLKSLGAAWQKLRTGKSDLDWLHDSGKVYPKEVLHWVSGVHGGIKEPVRQGIYARAMELGMKAAEERGLSPSTDEVLYKAISKDAYDIANMDIFMGDNFLTKAFHHITTNYLRNLKDDSGLAKFTANVLDILFPVVNAPTNIAIRKLRLVVGLPEAAVRLGQAAKRGDLANNAENLTPRDAELITRAFKYGIVGAAAGVYAWSHANQFGGIQTQGKQAPRDKRTGLAPGDIALPAGGHISHHFAHGPLGGHLNMIADARRVYDDQVKRGGSPWVSGGEAGFFMMFSAFKDLPMMTTVGRLTSPFKSAGQKAGEMMKNMFIFGAVQDAAKATDTDSSGNPVKRREDTFVDQIKSGIPGARQTVPKAGGRKFY